MGSEMCIRDRSEETMRQIPENVPLMLIKDDMAALHGCLAALD